MARILLIDDDDQVRTVLRLVLLHQNHTVIEARDGQEGLKLFAGANADLVITDLVMPETEGFEVLAELKKRQPRMQVVVITGGVRGKTANFLQMALRLGADRVLAKPFSNDQLTTVVNELLLAGQAPALLG